MNRRAFLRQSAAFAAAGFAARPSTAFALDAAQSGKRLVMPPLLDATSSGNFDLTASSGATSFYGNAASETIGFNQPYLGPVIRMKNSPIAASVSNGLKEIVTVHWHGLLVPGEQDGGPHLPIMPGSAWASEISLDQAPCTAFYHSHVHGSTAEQVYRGLAGMIQVTDGRDDERGLPAQYGVDDLALVIQDKRFDETGRMIYAQSMMDVMHGFNGNAILVNGQANAVAAVPKGIVRLRILNGSNARIFDLFAADGRPLHLAATDGGFLPAPVALESLRLGPGERAEILVDFSDGKPMVLMSSGDPNHGPGGMMGRIRSLVERLVTGDAFPVLSFAVDDREKPRIGKLPGELASPLPDLKSAIKTTRQLSLDMGMGGMMGGGMMNGGMMGGFGINGRAFDMGRIDLDIEKGTVERWIVASAMLSHPFHVHGASFLVASENGAPPRPESQGWKDTVVIDNGGQSELLIRFDQPASADKPFMFHCHILEHEDAGMMGQFTVT